jgi:Putative sterol carrier protein
MQNIDYSPLIQFIQSAFQPEAAVGMDFTVKLTITGAQDESWLMQIKNGQCTVERGAGLGTPDAEIALSQENLLRLLSGDLNPTLAMFTGKIHLSGDQSGLLKLASLFDVDKEKLKVVLQQYR